MKEDQIVKQEFKVGDIVRCHFYGDKEFELQENFASETYSLKFLDMFNSTCSLTKDGRIDIRHTHPVLTLIRRPSDMIKKEILLVGFISRSGSFNEAVKDSKDYRYYTENMVSHEITKVSERTIEVVG